MLTKKPWTIMVYLAADYNLCNFGVDSLRQMKAVANGNINVVAEFDTGLMYQSKRYVFDGRGGPHGPLDENIVQEFGPTDPTDPNNLVAFIKWAASEFPAEHYFIIIWGHGAGVDDDFPRPVDYSFVPRHHLLNLSKGSFSSYVKGSLDNPPKGMLDNPPKGSLDNPPKGILDTPVKEAIDTVFRGLVDSPLKSVLETRFKDLLNIPLSESFMAVDDAIEALKPAAIKALRNGIGKALEEDALNAFKSGSDTPQLLDADQAQTLKSLREAVLGNVEEDINQNHRLTALRQRVLLSLLKGLSDALQTSVLSQLQIEVLKALDELHGDRKAREARDVAVAVAAAARKIHDDVGRQVLNLLEAGILDTLRTTAGKPKVPVGSKSLAFVDHPASFLTNAGLKDALLEASSTIGKIDLFGMDACNMNMVEIGYDLRHSVRYMIASQDGIPDASWPYDRLLAHLADNPEVKPAELAKSVALTYRNSYNDYFDQKVTLSVLDVGHSELVCSLISDLTAALRSALGDLPGRMAIAEARTRARSFGANQFVDLVHFCQILSGSASALDLARTAGDFVSKISPFVLCNEVSHSEDGCHGVSIYFPRHDPQHAHHEKVMQEHYNRMDFATATSWGGFIAEYLKHAAAEELTALSLQPSIETAGREAGAASHKTGNQGTRDRQEETRAPGDIPPHFPATK